MSKLNETSIYQIDNDILVNIHYLFAVVDWLAPKTIEGQTTAGTFPVHIYRIGGGQRPRKWFLKSEVDKYVMQNRPNYNG